MESPGARLSENQCPATPRDTYVCGFSKDLKLCHHREVTGLDKLSSETKCETDRRKDEA